MGELGNYGERLNQEGEWLGLAVRPRVHTCPGHGTQVSWVFRNSRDCMECHCLSKNCSCWACGTVLKLPPVVLASLWAPVWVLAVVLWSSSLGRQWKMAQVLGLFSPTWEMQVEFSAPGFVLAQPSLLRTFREWNSWWKLSLSLPLILSNEYMNLFLKNKVKIVKCLVTCDLNSKKILAAPQLT